MELDYGNVLVQDRPIFDSIAYTMWHDRKVARSMLDTVYENRVVEFN